LAFATINFTVQGRQPCTQRPNWRTRSLYLYPRSDRGPSYTPRHRLLFRRLLRLAGLRWRYSNPPPHGTSDCTKYIFNIKFRRRFTGSLSECTYISKTFITVILSLDNPTSDLLTRSLNWFGCLIPIKYIFYIVHIHPLPHTLHGVMLNWLSTGTTLP
jgi:hypothetical protein